MTKVTFKLKEKVSILKKENNEMKSEVSFLLGLINSNPVLAKLYQDIMINPTNENLFMSMNANQYLLSLLFSSGLLNNVGMSPSCLSQLNDVSNSYCDIQCGQQYLVEQGYNYNVEGNSVSAY